MVNFNDIISYFETLARNHIDLRHSDNEKHFYRFELDEILTSFSNENSLPALILEGYDFNFIEPQSDNLMKSRNSAFCIVDYCGDENDFVKINTIYNKCEEIGDEILIRILSDKRSRSVDVVKHFDINSSSGNMLSNMSKGIYGMRYSFSLIAPRTNEIDNSKWLDK